MRPGVPLPSSTFLVPLVELDELLTSVRNGKRQVRLAAPPTADLATFAALRLTAASRRIPDRDRASRRQQHAPSHAQNRHVGIMQSDPR